MIKKLKITLLLGIIFWIVICTHSFARIKTNDPTVNSGGTVTITIRSDEPVASGAIKITSNDGLTFKSASGGTVNGNLVAFSKTNNETANIATYTFTAPEVNEDKKYKIVFSSQDMADENGNAVASSSATATVTVKKVANSGGNNGGSTGSSTPEKATMTKVKVGDKTYTKSGFTVKVENNVTSIKVVPTISNGESYTINGGTDNTVKLEEGTNTVNIKLASGNTYKIYIRRAAKVDDTPNIIDEEPKPKEEENIFLKSLIVKGVTLEEEKIELPLAPEFIAEIYEYEIILDETMSNITKLDIEAVANKDDCTIEIQGNEDIQDGENIVTITVKSKDGKITKTYKIFVTKCAETEPVIANTDEEPKQEENSFFTKSTLKIIIVAFTSGVAILGIIFAVIEYKYGKNEEQISFEEDDEIGEASFPGITLEKENELEEMYTPEYEEEKTKRKAKSKGKHF